MSRLNTAFLLLFSSLTNLLLATTPLPEITPYQYALLCVDVGQLESKLPPESDFVVFMEVGETLKSKGLRARAYVSKKQPLRPVVAFSGTKTLADAFISDRQILQKKVPENYYMGVAFMKQVLAHMQQKEIPKSALTLTGHSLGAFTAEVIGVDDNIKVVSFESPGSRTILNLHFNYTHEYLDKAPITTYLNIYNPVNTNGKHVGKVIRMTKGYEGLDLSLYKGNTDKPLNMFVLSAFNLHRMGQVLKSIDPVTGYPREMQETKEWPANNTEGFYCYYLNYTKNQGYWDNVVKYAWQIGETGKETDYRKFKTQYIRVKLLDEPGETCTSTFNKLVKENFAKVVDFGNALMNQVKLLMSKQFSGDLRN